MRENCLSGNTVTNIRQNIWRNNIAEVHTRILRFLKICFDYKVWCISISHNLQSEPPFFCYRKCQ